MLIARRENFGITYGPIRTASATWRGVACVSSGGSAPVTSPPCATTWWQPAQCSVNSASPWERLPRAGCGVGIGGPPKVAT